LNKSQITRLRLITAITQKFFLPRFSILIRPRDMKCAAAIVIVSIVFVIFVTLSASIALAEESKTINGKDYKNATVSRVERDGIILRTKSGISKIYFTELPKEVQERFQYEPDKVAIEQKAFEDKRTEVPVRRKS
jgi:hypothetical protein